MARHSYTTRILSVLIASIFLLNNTVYALGPISKSHLRAPITVTTYNRITDVIRSHEEHETAGIDLSLENAFKEGRAKNLSGKYSKEMELVHNFLKDNDISDIILDLYDLTEKHGKSSGIWLITPKDGEALPAEHASDRGIYITDFEGADIAVSYAHALAAYIGLPHFMAEAFTEEFKKWRKDPAILISKSKENPYLTKNIEGSLAEKALFEKENGKNTFLSYLSKQETAPYDPETGIGPYSRRDYTMPANISIPLAVDSPVKLVLFSAENVLFDVDFHKTVESLKNSCPALKQGGEKQEKIDNYLYRLLTSRSSSYYNKSPSLGYRLDSGTIPFDKFYVYLVSRLKTKFPELKTGLGLLEKEQLVRAWNAAYIAPIEENFSLMKELIDKGYKVKVIANSNALHRERALSLLRGRHIDFNDKDFFSSHTMGKLRGADSGVFNAILNTRNEYISNKEGAIYPENVLFVDDSYNNIKQAREEAGIEKTVHYYRDRKDYKNNIVRLLSSQKEDLEHLKNEKYALHSGFSSDQFTVVDPSAIDIKIKNYIESDRSRPEKEKNVFSLDSDEFKIVRLEFMDAINKSWLLKSMSERLTNTLGSNDGRIQFIYIDNENDLPVFEGKKVWGHASSKYITVFVKKDELGTQETRKNILARLFHEIRARSTKAREWFDNVDWNNLASWETAESRLKALEYEFESMNTAIEEDIKRNGYIKDQNLLQEVSRLKFDGQLSMWNRDYAIKTKDSYEASVYLNSLMDSGKNIPIALGQEIMDMYLYEHSFVGIDLLSSIRPSYSQYDKDGNPVEFRGITTISKLRQDDLFTKFVQNIKSEEGVSEIPGISRWQKENLAKDIISIAPIGKEHMTLYDGSTQRDLSLKYAGEFNMETKNDIEKEAEEKSLSVEQATYNVLERRIKNALQGFSATKAPKFKPIGIASFPLKGENTTTLVVDLAPKTAEDLAIVTKVQEAIREKTGILLNPTRGGTYKAHITIGYFTNIPSDEDLGLFKNYLLELDSYIKQNSDDLIFELPLIEISRFNNVENFPIVEEGSFSWTTPLTDSRTISSYKEGFKDILKNKNNTLKLNGKSVSKNILTALDRLGWLKDQITIVKKGSSYGNTYDFELDPESIDIVLFDADYAENYPDKFLEDVAKIGLNKKAVIIPKNAEQKAYLESMDNIASQLNDKIFILKVSDNNKVYEELGLLLADEKYYDFSMAFTQPSNIINNIHVLHELSLAN
ncbi:MAG: hypothetical protein ABIG92_03065 [Candidatus Omnitrophota bacterium]